jgi:hypothetical protein
MILYVKIKLQMIENLNKLTKKYNFYYIYIRLRA